MRAASGAIEHIKIDETTFKPNVKIIGEQGWNTGKPKGICGSAMIDAVAELFRVGILDSSGKFGSLDSTDRLRLWDNGL